MSSGSGPAASAAGTGNCEAQYGTSASAAMQTVAPIFSTNAADRTECYPLIAFGSQNCCVYCDSFPEEDGRYQLTQLFDSSDRLSCEWCDKERGVCKQARDAAGDLASCDLSGGTHGGEDQEPDEDPTLCCKALTAECLACAAGVTPYEYCLKYPETLGCKVYAPPSAAPPMPITFVPDDKYTLTVLQVHAHGFGIRRSGVVAPPGTAGERCARRVASAPEASSGWNR